VVEAETPSLKADNRDLCYFAITIVDKNGDRICNAEHELQCVVSGGTLMGIFSGNPCNEDAYGSNCCHAFEGRASAIIRTNTPGKINISVSNPSLITGAATVTGI